MKIDEAKRLVEEFIQNGQCRNVGEIKAFLVSKGYSLKELYQELEMTSRLVDTHQDISEVGGVVQLHSHVFYELIYCCSNSEIQYLIGNERYRLGRGDVVLIAPGIPHRPIWTANSVEPYHREVIWASEEFVEGLSTQMPGKFLKEEKGHILLHTAGTKWEIIGQCFHAGVTEAEQREPGWQAMACAAAMQVMTYLARAMKEDAGVKARAEHPELLEEVMHYVEHHLTEKITLEKTAKQFLVSTSTISQMFHKQMDVSFYRYVTQRRLIDAKNKINIGVSMEKVAEQVGFCDYSSFYRAFKQEYGISPRQYKQMGENKRGGNRE